MNVIRAMTVDTIGSNLLHRFQRTSMAAVAGHVNMGSRERKIRLRIVIEQPKVPGDRVVTQRAIICEPAVMIVVFQVAADAIFFGIHKYLGLVAILALVIRVISQQWKTCQVVIKVDRVIPVDFRMTIFT